MIKTFSNFENTILNDSDSLYFSKNYVAEPDRNSYLDTFQIIAPDIPQPKPHIPNPILLKDYDYVGNNEFFNINPPVLHFRGFNQNCIYEKEIDIVNKSNETQKMHIISPQSQYFKLEHNKSEKIVPGTITKLLVKFMPNEIRYYYDSIKIHCQNDNNLIIPIHAYQVAEINKFPSMIDFKAVSVGEVKKKVFSLECEAQIDFEFTILIIQPHPSFTVEPMSGLISAGNKVDISVYYKPFEYSTVCMKFQINICQFFSKPIFCTVTGYSKPGIKKDMRMANEIAMLKTKSKTHYPLATISKGKNKIRNIKSASAACQIEEKNINKNAQETLPLQLNQLRVVRQPNELPIPRCEFNLLSVNVWNRKFTLLWKFKQAVRKIIKRNRLITILKKLKANKNMDFDQADADKKERDVLKDLRIEYKEENVDRKIFSLYTPLLSKELDLITNKEYAVNVECKFKENLVFNGLKVCMQYKILGYKRECDIASLTSLVKTRSLKTENSNNNNTKNNSSSRLKQAESNPIKENITPIQMPQNLYNVFRYPPGYIANPEPMTTAYISPMPWSEFDPDFHMNPLPQFVCSGADSSVCTSQKKFLDGEDFICGTMKWRGLNSCSLDALNNFPTFLDRSSLPKCSYQKIDVSGMMMTGLSDDDLMYINSMK